MSHVQEMSLPMVLGITIPSLVLLILVTVAICCILKRKKESSQRCGHLPI